MTDKTEAFFEAWGMTDAADRLAALQAAVTSDASYADPRTDAPLSGPEAIAAYVGMFSQAAPGAVAEVVHTDTRDGVTRATIAFKMPNGMEQMGQYFIEHDAVGLICRMVGFVGTGTPT
ncbi:nuclear transport factor 2 family protein [Yoonia sediminilitoris]|uniref:SnoaL-like protein n=1 Tax=Yoonia sediminilitoris TaxID=1286148 RepID=A0A2T6KK73_9RHOB|nr:nuclear transport factor 2 family protein [Yoonia sediminilitoris]PUB16364.1 SnoaL-like protein [Yoonia sediminilitoris]RCW96713.1 SnoaL-like protein [Yoonia sediminilitoris]